MGGRINTIMQTCFFAIVGRPAPRRRHPAKIKGAIEKTYGMKGEGSRAAQPRRGRCRRWSTCCRSRSPATVTSTSTVVRPIVSGRGAGLRAEGHQR